MQNLALKSPLKPTSEISLTDEFQQAFEVIEHTKQNIFLTGEAGTGKSTFLKFFRLNTKKNMAVVAPTGVAALNVSGQTIHSFFRLKPSFIDLDKLKPNYSNIVKKLDLLIIDEISMVRADIFEAIDRVLRLSKKNNKPFGGVQICAIGDLFQLPPIVSNEERAFFSEFYESPFFFSTNAYKNADFKTIKFKTIHRQNDVEFISILNSIRCGKCSNSELQRLNKNVQPNNVAEKGTLVLATTNQIADNINSQRLSALPSKARIYDGEIKGDFGLNGARLPAPENLALKIGAQVMFVKNDTELGRWVNGTIGVVEKFTDDSIFVKANGSTHEVKKEKWKAVGFEFNEESEKITEKTLGTYTQFPLILAWAITIHKSQGKTLDNVIIDLGNGAFAFGQLYVALSRCKTLDGISLKRPASFRDIICDQQVIKFYEDLV